MLALCTQCIRISFVCACVKIEREGREDDEGCIDGEEQGDVLRETEQNTKEFDLRGQDEVEVEERPSNVNFAGLRASCCLQKLSTLASSLLHTMKPSKSMR